MGVTKVDTHIGAAEGVVKPSAQAYPELMVWRRICHG